MSQGAEKCRQCGAALNPDETRGLCPVCLLQTSLAEQEEPDVHEPVDTAWLERNLLAVSPEAGAKPDRLGDYELLEEIGRGGMGIIYRARQTSLDRLVAVKTILTGPLASPDFAHRFQTEAHAAAVLDHPHIVPIYEVGNHRGQPFYSMRLIAGRNLAQELKATGAMAPRRAAESVATVARAVHYAHQRGILHRDLKPANILLDGEGQPHVTDFGLAKLLEQDDGLTLTQAALGTPNYMAPEQAAGNVSELTTAADVYSLGAILFEVLTGRKLFTAATPLATINRARDQEPPKPSSILRTIPRDLDTICWKCLEKEPHRRYASALALAEDLERWLAGEPIRARRVGAIERVGLWCRRKPALAGLAGAALVTLTIVSGVAFWRVRNARQQEDLERYTANISLADGAVRAGSMDLALDHLLKCPERLRHWEWGRLLFECFQEANSIPAHTNRPQFLERPLIDNIAFNRDGSRLSSRGLEGTLAVWDPLEARQIIRVGDATNEVRASAFRPGGNEIAVGRLDGSVELLDSETGRLISRLVPSHPEWTNQSADPVVRSTYDVYDTGTIRDRLRRRPWAVISLGWDRAGARMVAVRTDGTVSVLTNPEPGRAGPPGRPFGPRRAQRSRPTEDRSTESAGNAWTWSPPEPGSTVAAWFVPDGSAVVIQSPGLAQRFDPATGRELSALRWDAPTGNRSGAWVAPGGDRVIILDSERRVTLRAARGLVADLGRLVQRNGNSPLEVFFSRDGSLFCTTGDVGTARVFRVETGEVLFPLPDTVYGGAFSAEGDQLAVFGMDRIVHLWDVHQQWEVRPLRGHLSLVTGVTFAPGERLLATASREGVVKIWSARHHGRILFGDAVALSSGYSPNGRWLATAPLGRGVRLWEAKTGRLQWKVFSRTQWAVTLVFSPDNRRLYAAGSDRCVRIYRVTDGQPAGMLRGHQHPVWMVACSPDGKRVATGDVGGVVKLWDAQTGHEQQSLAAHPGRVESVFFDAHSRFLVTAGRGKPKVWDVATGRLVVELDEGGGGTFHAAFSPDGRQVVGVCLDHQIRRWEVPSGRAVTSWPGQTQGSSYVSYSPDGLRFAVLGADYYGLGGSLSKLEIWDTKHGRALLNLEGHREVLYTAQFDASGQRLVTASMDATVRQWEAFPWRDADYAEPKAASLPDRVRHFAGAYWRERVAQADDTSAAVRPSEEEPLPPGIPDWERDRWPARDPAASPLQVNLDHYYTGVLDASLYPTGNDLELEDDLSGLTTGLQRFGGVLFDVRGVILLRPELPVPAQHQCRTWWHHYPERVEGIAIGRKFQKLHVLHAAATEDLLNFNPRLMKEALGNRRALGAYVLHYADGTRHEYDLQYGRDLRLWWWGGRGDDAPEAERAKVAWVGTNSVSSRHEAKVRLFLSSFENPRPDVEVVSVDFISKQAPLALFLVAMTVEP